MPPIVGGMALTPETSAALKQALEAVIQECGDTPGYEDFIGKLKDAEAAIPAEHAAPEHAPEHAEHDAPEGEDAAPGEDASADEMFAHAEKQHKAKAKGKHANPFADDKGAA